MTRAIEDELATAMRNQAAGLIPAPDIVARAARRHRRRARIRLGASVTAAAGITALVVAVGLPGASTRAGSTQAGSQGPGAAGPGVRPPARPVSEPARASRPLPKSPRARLLAAMTRSAQLSYRMHLVNMTVLPDHKATVTSPIRDLIDWYADYTGTYDPRTRSGSGVNTDHYESGGIGNPRNFGKPAGHDQVRIIGDRYYTRYSPATSFRPGITWTTGEGSIAKALDLNGGQDWAPTSGASADPAVLLATVRRLGQVRLTGRSGSGAHALDTYRFRYQIAGNDSVKPHQLAGKIVVHHQSDLIAKITMETTVTGADPAVGDGGLTQVHTVLTFSDYGVAVTVHPPAPATVTSTNVNG
jgi:hypothetical protein